MVIMEADLSMELREWYLQATKQFGWSKTELIENITDNAHKKIVLNIEDNMCYSMEKRSKATAGNWNKAFDITIKLFRRIRKCRFKCRAEGGVWRRWRIVQPLISAAMQSNFM